jgi:hypothetical protein
MNTTEVVQPRHVERQAVVYVRQSTPHQALAHQESLQMQYGCASPPISWFKQAER